MPTGNGRTKEDEEKQRRAAMAGDERTAEEWAELAAQKAENASQKSHAAAAHALAAHQEIGVLHGAVARLDGRLAGVERSLAEIISAVNAGFEKIAGKVREQQRSLSDIIHEDLAPSPEDNTQVRNVKAVAVTEVASLEHKVKALEAARDAAEAEKKKAAADAADNAKFWKRAFITAIIGSVVTAVIGSGVTLAAMSAANWLHLR